jgi:hypothetical protein
MSPTLRHDFILNFNTSLNQVFRINLPRANEHATGTEISEAMDAIVASGAVESSRGTPVSRHSADLLTSQRTEFNVA